MLTLGNTLGTTATPNNLYNGNISTWASKNSTGTNGALDNTWTQQFTYDQLNRIKTGITSGGTNNYKNSYNYDANGNILALNRFDKDGLQIDQLAYNYQNNLKGGSTYKTNTNRLLWVDELAAVSATEEDIEDQADGNYAYDEIGNLIKDDNEEIAQITWNVSGKITNITRKATSTKPDLAFTYNAMGKRITKTVYAKNAKGTINHATTTYYIHDAAGNTMATYNVSTNAPTLALQEQSIYGSSRLGLQTLQGKQYELTDHLGNVRTVINENNTVASATDYYPFGMVAKSFSNGYRFGFNGKEKVDEISGSGNYYDFEGRMFDPRIVRTPSPDPNSIKYPALSPYSFLANNPINVVDYNGKDAVYIAFPSYKADGYPMTGHAGVLLIDNKTGLTKYYEYGRYDKAQVGIVKSYEIPNVIIGADGRPTAESLNKVLQTISQKSGKGQEIEGAYIESDKFKEMNDYAQGKLKENTDPNRDPYSITGNNCGTFACDVINQDESLNTPTILDPRPVSIVDEYQDNFTPLSYDPKKGTTVEYSEKTVSYDKNTKKTSTSQSWFQKLVHGDKTSTDTKKK